MPHQKPEFLPNEIILELDPDVHPHHLPHFLDLKKNQEPESSDFGIAELDQWLHRLLPRVSVSRIFIPNSGLRESIKGKNIGENYNIEEQQIGIAHTYLVTFEEGDLPLARICQRLKKLPMVREAHPNHIIETSAKIYSNYATYCTDGMWGLSVIQCQKAWEIESGLPEIVIAIIDTGLDLEHEVFQDRVSQWQYDFVHKTTPLPDPFRFQLVGDYHTPDPDPSDFSGHGTQCAGIAVGGKIQSSRFAGVCPNATILPLRVFYSYQDLITQTITDKGTEADINAAIHYAVNSGADIISMSFGGPRALYQSALEYAGRHNVCMFAACGNEGHRLATYPACDDRVLAVGAVNHQLKRIATSNYGTHYHPFLMAPGQDVLCPHLDNTYYHLTGTSISTPFVAGAAGLILSLAKRIGKTLKAKEVYDILLKTAKPPAERGKKDMYYGEGILDVHRALIETQKRLKMR